MKKNNISIENLFNNLDKIISSMDDEKCTIEKNIELYKDGLKLINELTNKVDKIEKDIEVLSNENLN